MSEGALPSVIACGFTIVNLSKDSIYWSSTRIIFFRVCTLILLYVAGIKINVPCIYTTTLYYYISVFLKGEMFSASFFFSVKEDK